MKYFILDLIFLGRKQTRLSWTSEEKETARNYFSEEIYNNLDVSRQKVKRFFHLHKDLYKHRTRHLIIQWIKCQQKNILNEKEGYSGNSLK